MDRRAFLGLGLGALPLARVPALMRPEAVAARPGLALVTADTEAHVVAVDFARARVAARIPTVEDPRSIQSGPSGVAVVAHSAVGRVTLLEDRPVRVRRVLGGFGTPRYTAIAAGGGYAFVTDGGHGELATVDLTRGRVVSRVAVGDGARHVTMDPDGRTLWIALGSSAEEIAVVDISEPSRPRVLRRIVPPFLAHDVGFSPSGRRVWVTAGRERRLAVLDAATGRPRRLLGADDAPQHVTFSAGFAYVASGDGGSVRVHGLRDGAVRRRTKVPFGSYNVQRAGGRVLTPSLAHGTLTVLDLEGTVRAEVHVAPAAHDACAV